MSDYNGYFTKSEKQKVKKTKLLKPETDISVSITGVEDVSGEKCA